LGYGIAELVYGGGRMAHKCAGWCLGVLVFSAIPQPAISAVAPGCRSGLVGLWSGEGNANDSDGPKHGTAVINVAYAAGVTGEAFLFDGINSYVNIPPADDLFFANDQAFTLEAWFRPTSTAGSFFLLRNAAYGIRWGPPDSPIAFYNGQYHFTNQ